MPYDGAGERAEHVRAGPAGADGAPQGSARRSGVLSTAAEAAPGQIGDHDEIISQYGRHGRGGRSGGGQDTGSEEKAEHARGEPRRRGRPRRHAADTRLPRAVPLSTISQWQ